MQYHSFWQILREKKHTYYACYVLRHIYYQFLSPKLSIFILIMFCKYWLNELSFEDKKRKSDIITSGSNVTLYLIFLKSNISLTVTLNNHFSRGITLLRVWHWNTMMKIIWIQEKEKKAKKENDQYFSCQSLNNLTSYYIFLRSNATSTVKLNSDINRKINASRVWHPNISQKQLL